MKPMSKAAASAMLAFGAMSARAEQWVDWSPAKGAAHKTWIRVDPTRMDDYLTGLRRTWGTSQAIREKRGIISSYHVLMRDNVMGDEPNVLLVTVYPSMAMMDADRDRALSFQKEYNAVVSKDEAKAMVAKYDEWRKPVAMDDLDGDRVSQVSSRVRPGVPVGPA